MPGRLYLVLLDLLSLRTDSLVVLLKPVSELLVRRLLKDGLLPQVGGQVGVGGGHGSVGSLGEVAKSSGGATSAGVAVLDTGHLEQLLGDGCGHDPGTAGGGNQSHPDGAALAGHLAGDGVRLADLVPPEPAPNGHDDSLARMMAPRMAVATSLEHLTPRPTWPL